MRPASTLSCAALFLLVCIGGPAHAEEDPEEASTETPEEKPEEKPEAKPEEKPEEKPTQPSLADRFAGSSVLVEHAFSIAHGQDLSPEYTRTIQRILIFKPSFDVSPKLSVAAELGMSQELTVTDTTYPYETMLDDLKAGFAVNLPERKAGKLNLSASAGMDMTFPTSKASMASSLITGFEPWLEVSLTAPLLDGLSLSYRVTPNPRIHRYSTTSLRVPRPCSPAAGCSLGSTTDVGERNTALQLHQDISLSLSALDSKLSLLGYLILSYSVPYPKSPSERFDESILSDPANKGGSPVTLSSVFLFDIGYQIHPGIGLSVGLWTPGGMTPSGGWYNPLGNRFSQIYLDVTISPVALVQAGLKGLASRKAAADTER